jgi:hypothetical protein
MYGLPPLSLPPPIPLTGRRTYPIANTPHIGEQIDFADLVPGESYFRQFIPYAFSGDNFEEIELVSKERNATGQLTGEYSYRIPYPMMYEIDPKGDPTIPMPIPQAPSIFNPFEVIHSDSHQPNLYRFYKVAAVRRGRHMVGPLIKEKVKKNIRRKHLDMMLNKLDFSTDVGTGPADIIRKFVDLQPPRGAKSMPLRTRKEGGKRRKTRKTSKLTK